MKLLMSYLVVVALGALLTAQTASASLVLKYSGSSQPPITNTDAGGLAEITVPPSSFQFDIVYEDATFLPGLETSGGAVPSRDPLLPSVWGFRVDIADTNEIPADGAIVTSYSFDPTGSISGAGGSSVWSSIGASFIDQHYWNPVDLPSGTILARFSVTPGSLGSAPDDEDPDLVLRTSPTVVSVPVRISAVFDPGTGGLAISVGFDAESDAVPAVPIPAALPLFGTALAGLGVIGWRKRKSS